MDVWQISRFKPTGEHLIGQWSYEHMFRCSELVGDSIAGRDAGKERRSEEEVRKNFPFAKNAPRYPCSCRTYLPSRTKVKTDVPFWDRVDVGPLARVA